MYSNQPSALANSWLKPKGIDIGKITIETACINITGENMTNCTNLPVPIIALTTGTVAKIPIVLAELAVQININAIINFPQPAIKIKKVDNHLKISQCLLLQDSNKLFIKGFIKKSITYLSKASPMQLAISEAIRHCTVDIPFQCVTSITYNGSEPLPIVPRTISEFTNKDKGFTADLSGFNQISTEYYNELPLCQLVCSQIVQFAEYLNPMLPAYFRVPFLKKHFRSFEEKAVVLLTLRVLQNQLVAIPPQYYQDHNQVSLPQG